MPSKYLNADAEAVAGIWNDGFAVAESGEVEAPTGAFVLVQHADLYWVAREDSNGFFDAQSFGTLARAEERYDALCAAYQEWDLHPDDCMFCVSGESQIHNYEPAG